ncbi:putative metal-binding protein [Duganella sp. HH101]|uniref:putative metal-binding protein n=1 Tax=Duganella sp. HH101 TaxID=1781066 RepID=UPI0008FC3C16|nr:putative metal-binding protein [Duganella sp. HH101]
MAHELLSKRHFEDDVKHLTDRFLENRAWVLNQLDYPCIDVTFVGTQPLRVKFKCDGWPDQPPAAELLDSAGNPYPNMPGFTIFNANTHPVTQAPAFICMRGIREYHTHPSHLSEHWNTHMSSDGNSLVGLLDQISTAWRKVYPK